MIQVDTHLKGYVCLKGNERFRFLTRSYVFTQSLIFLYVIPLRLPELFVHELCIFWGFRETTFQCCENWKLKSCLVRIRRTRKQAWRKQNLLKGKAFGSELSVLQDVLGFVQHLLLHHCVAGGRGLQHPDCSSAVGTFQVWYTIGTKIWRCLGRLRDGAMAERCRVPEWKRRGWVSSSEYLVCFHPYCPFSDLAVLSGQVHLFIILFQRGLSSFPKGRKNPDSHWYTMALLWLFISLLFHVLAGLSISCLDVGGSQEWALHSAP